MAEELSGVTVVIIIAGGVLGFILSFIFAKRQIMRFALKSRRGPHVPIAHGEKKSVRRETERRIEVIPKIIYEPKLIDDSDPRYYQKSPNETNDLPKYYYRVKAVDDVKLLEKQISSNDRTLVRHPTENLRAYLLNTLANSLNGTTGQRTVHQFCDLYEHARYDPNEFGREEYQAYSNLLSKLLDGAKMMKNYNRKNSPNKSPVKKNLEKSKIMNEVMEEQQLIMESCMSKTKQKNNETCV